MVFLRYCARLMTMYVRQRCHQTPAVSRNLLDAFNTLGDFTDLFRAKALRHRKPPRTLHPLAFALGVLCLSFAGVGRRRPSL